MSTAAALPYTYAYRHASGYVEDAERPRLVLATATDSPVQQFFEGRLLAPRRTADLLVTVANVVGSRFHVPAAMLGKIVRLADPVITCSDERLRFEGFSACCGAYARADLLGPALAGRFTGTGTANVDFSGPMRAALGRIRDDDEVALSLGADAFEVRSGATAVIERRVDLPARWLRGFADVQAALARLEPRFDVDGATFRRFLHDLPPAWKGRAWIVRSGAEVRVAACASHHAVGIGGITRLHVLRTAARHAIRVRFFAEPAGASAVELETPDARLTLALSPDVWRGFSGEGATLAARVAPASPAALAATRAALRWQNAIDAGQIARAASLERHEIDAALATYAASGIVGYDLAERAYFHRELPFDVAESFRAPRLRAADRLIASDAVEIDADASATALSAWVHSGGVAYRVHVANGLARCTCPWYAKHRDERGPCKHVLAVTRARETRDAGA